MSGTISIARVNNRLPMLAVGLAWDSGFSSQNELNNAALKQALSGDDLDAAAKNPFHIMSNSTKGALVDMQLILVAVGGGRVLGHVDGDELEALDGALAHTGDDKSGSEGGWDELANVALNGLPAEVEKVAIFAHSRNGHNLSQVANLKAAVLSLRDNTALFEAPLGSGGYTHLFAMFVRQGDDFVLQPVQSRVEIKSLADVPAALTHIQ